MTPMQHDVATIFSVVDEDGSGTIDAQEFHHVIELLQVWGGQRFLGFGFRFFRVVGFFRALRPGCRSPGL